jgi:hypothetical protein
MEDNMVVRFEHGQELVTLPADTRDASRPFSSGGTGFYAGGKVIIDGERYQVSCSVVKVRTPEEKAAAAAQRERAQIEA